MNKSPSIRRGSLGTLVILTALLSGCVNGPPPRIEGNRYINSPHRFAFEIPKQWNEVGEVPHRFRSKKEPPGTARTQLESDYMSHGIRTTVEHRWAPTAFSDLLLLAPGGSAILAVRISNSGPRLARLSLQEQAQAWTSFFEDEKQLTRRLRYVSDYSYAVHPMPLNEIPTHVATARFRQTHDEGNLQAVQMTYAHLIGDNDTCLIGILLLSDESLINQNVKALNHVMGTIKPLRLPTDDSLPSS